MRAEGLLAHFERIAEAPGAVERLRGFVLDLAVRGLLVGQDVGDELAAELMNRIRSEKKRLEKSGTLKRQKPLTPIEEELPFSVPKSWIWEKLGNLCSYIQRGKSPKYACGPGLPVISQKCVQWNGLNLDVAKFITVESVESYDQIRFLQEGDLLWNSTGTGTIGRVVRIQEPPANLVCDSHVTVVRCLFVDERFIQIWLRSDHVYGTIEKRAAGSTKQVELTASMAKNQMVPLPPLPEQHRIVAKVDELMALCDELAAAQARRENRRNRLVAATLHGMNNGDGGEGFRENARFYFHQLPRLTTRVEHVEELRRAILNLAVRGRLATQDLEDEPASELLAQIRKKQHKNRKAKVRISKNKSQPINEEEPFELPDGWAWAHFQELGIFGRGKSKHRPRNDPTLFEEGIYPFVQTGDVAKSHGSIDTFSGKYNEKGLSQSQIWPKGTICITIAANIADSGILSFDACFPDSVVGFIPDKDLSSTCYFEYFIRTIKNNLFEFAPSTAQKNINLGILNKVLIPLPPLAEQHRIVAKVDELMAHFDDLETHLKNNETTAARLIEAALHEALSA